MFAIATAGIARGIPSNSALDCLGGLGRRQRVRPPPYGYELGGGGSRRSIRCATEAGGGDDVDGYGADALTFA